MIITDQKISETMPYTFSGDTWTGCGSDGLKTVCSVYSGLVPISPNTTPRAPTASASPPAPSLIALPAYCPPPGQAHPSETGVLPSGDQVSASRNGSLGISVARLAPALPCRAHLVRDLWGSMS